MKGNHRKMKFGTIIAAAALTVLTACGPKSAFNSSKTPISENKPLPVLFSEWSGGTCTFNSIEERVKYKDKGEKFTNYFDVHDEESAVKIYCSDKKTFIVNPESISVYGQGGIPGENPVDENVTAMLQNAHDAPIEIISIKYSVPNEKNEVNIASVSSDNHVFVLARNTETNELSITRLHLDHEDENYFPIGKLLKGKVDIMVHNGIIFIAGEAEKGENYLHALKISDGYLAHLSFKTKKELKGEVKFNSGYDKSGEKILVLQIGEKKFYINAELSETKLPGFEDMRDGTFAKITVTK